jgi:hypothetical protein
MTTEQKIIRAKVGLLELSLARTNKTRPTSAIGVATTKSRTDKAQSPTVSSSATCRILRDKQSRPD